jgi:4-hydroxyacetophenone monooxygenase
VARRSRRRSIDALVPEPLVVAREGAALRAVDPHRPPGSVDRERLEAALRKANIPTLLMVLTHLTGDERWLQSPYRPTRPRGLDPHDSGGLPDDVCEQIRAATLDAVVGWAEGKPVALPAPDAPLLQHMLSTSMGEPVPEEYQRLMREEMGLASDDDHENPERQPDGFSVLIVGAGVSGLVAAVRLREAGIPFRILERLDDVGGVWVTNRYPGAGVDTPSYLYSFSFFPRNWSTHFGKRDEMVTYIGNLADHFDLRRDITFGADVERMTYDEGAQQWRVEARTRSGWTTFTANTVISAVGLFNKPKRPPIPGLDRFAGPLFHTAEWPDRVDLAGKRVAVIGTGASAMQVVPAIVDEVASLTVFQRSPQWIAPSEQYFTPVGSDVHWLMEHVPYYQVWYRFRLAWTFNDRVHGSLRIDPEWPDTARSLNAVNDGHRRAFTRYLEEQLDGREDLQRKTLPDYPPFGKRMLLDNGWFSALKRPHVELVTARVAEITERSVVTATGETYEVDVVVLATGFDAQRYIHPIEVHGRGGRRLRDEWGEDDARAYLGITVAGYPNLFLMYGPNTNTGAGGSYIFIAECQARYIVRLLATMVDEGLGAIECRADVQEAWIEEIDAAHAEMIWTHPGMSNYYRNARGRVVTNMPYRIVDYWTMTHEPDLSCFTTEGRAAEAPTRSG